MALGGAQHAFQYIESAGSADERPGGRCFQFFEERLQLKAEKVVNRPDLTGSNRIAVVKLFK